ncbi:IS66 family transposase zinc-finger binding domain-containing protein [Bradyrhizobium sp. DASA03005]|uniref:IS66 family transposase zinc-finger binding domain-containing protein n=1 Tax=Bradyrhizobium sp. SPXBL-02 TaxID=3395912 RepID=UPI003F70E73F
MDGVVCASACPRSCAANRNIVPRDGLNRVGRGIPQRPANQVEWVRERDRRAASDRYRCVASACYGCARGARQRDRKVRRCDRRARRRAVANGSPAAPLAPAKRAQFGRSSEKLDPEQLQLALEDIEQAVAGDEAVEDKKDPAGAHRRADKRCTSRGALPPHLPHVDVTIAPEDTNCPCCRVPMHVIGEETSKRLDLASAQFRVIVTHRPKYACRACTDGVVQPQHRIG